MSLLKVIADETKLPEETFCEACGVLQSREDIDWQHRIDTVEEVEISWADGDEGVVRSFDTKPFFDLCATCAIIREAPLTNYEALPSEL